MSDKGVELERRISSCAAANALKKTAQRGLKFHSRQVLLDVMYDLPSHNNLARVVVDEATIANDGKPLLMFADTPKVASAHS
jgi:ATP-dependent Clp protease ATP-binding subunit ClpX